MEEMKYLIEDGETHLWWDGRSWTNSPDEAKKFDSVNDAQTVLPDTAKDDPSKTVLITEHIWMD